MAATGTLLDTDQTPSTDLAAPSLTLSSDDSTQPAPAQSTPDTDQSTQPPSAPAPGQPPPEAQAQSPPVQPPSAPDPWASVAATPMYQSLAPEDKEHVLAKWVQQTKNYLDAQPNLDQQTTGVALANFLSATLPQIQDEKIGRYVDQAFQARDDKGEGLGERVSNIFSTPFWNGIGQHMDEQDTKFNDEVNKPGASTWDQIAAYGHRFFADAGLLGQGVTGTTDQAAQSRSMAIQADKEFGAITDKDQAIQSFKQAQAFEQNLADGKNIVTPEQREGFGAEAFGHVGFFDKGLVNAKATLWQAQDYLNQLKSQDDLQYAQGTARLAIKNFFGSLPFVSTDDIRIDTKEPTQVAQRNALLAAINQEEDKQKLAKTIAGGAGTVAGFALTEGIGSAITNVAKASEVAELAKGSLTAAEAEGSGATAEEIAKLSTNATKADLALDAAEKAGHRLAMGLYSTGENFKDDPRQLGFFGRAASILSNTATMLAADRVAKVASGPIEDFAKNNADALGNVGTFAAKSIGGGVSGLTFGMTQTALEGGDPTQNWKDQLLTNTILGVGMAGSEAASVGLAKYSVARNLAKQVEHLSGMFDGIDNNTTLSSEDKIAGKNAILLQASNGDAVKEQYLRSKLQSYLAISKTVDGAVAGRQEEANLRANGLNEAADAVKAKTDAGLQAGVNAASTTERDLTGVPVEQQSIKEITRSGAAANLQAHEDVINDALAKGKPVSAEAVDSYQIPVPEGYTRQGFLYAKPEMQPSETASKPGKAVTALTPEPETQARSIDDIVKGNAKVEWNGMRGRISRDPSDNSLTFRTIQDGKPVNYELPFKEGSTLSTDANIKVLNPSKLARSLETAHQELVNEHIPGNEQKADEILNKTAEEISEPPFVKDATEHPLINELTGRLEELEKSNNYEQRKELLHSISQDDLEKAENIAASTIDRVEKSELPEDQKQGITHQFYGFWHELNDARAERDLYFPDEARPIQKEIPPDANVSEPTGGGATGNEGELPPVGEREPGEPGAPGNGGTTEPGGSGGTVTTPEGKEVTPSETIQRPAAETGGAGKIGPSGGKAGRAEDQKAGGKRAKEVEGKGGGGKTEAPEPRTTETATVDNVTKALNDVAKEELGEKAEPIPRDAIQKAINTANTVTANDPQSVKEGTITRITNDLIRNLRDTGDPFETEAGGAYNPYWTARSVHNNYWKRKGAEHEVHVEAPENLQAEPAFGTSLTEAGESFASRMMTEGNNSLDKFANNLAANPPDYLAKWLKSNRNATTTPAERIRESAARVFDDLIRFLTPKTAEQEGVIFANPKGGAATKLQNNPEFRAMVENEAFNVFRAQMHGEGDEIGVENLFAPDAPKDGKGLTPDNRALLAVLTQRGVNLAPENLTRLLPDDLRAKADARTAKYQLEKGSCSALATIANDPKADPLLKVAARELAKTGVNLKVKLDPTLETTGRSGKFDPVTATVTVNPFLSEEDFHRAVVHEQIHGMLSGKTHLFLDGNHTQLSEADRTALQSLELLRNHVLVNTDIPDVIRDIAAERDYSQQQAMFERAVNENAGLRKYYGVLNLHEFATEAATNPAFQNILGGIEAPVEEGMPKGVIGTLWDRAKSFLRSLVFGEQKPESALSRAFDQTLKLSDSGPTKDQTLANESAARRAAPSFRDDSANQLSFLNDWAKSHGYDSAEAMLNDRDGQEDFATGAKFYRLFHPPPEIPDEALSSFANSEDERDQLSKTIGEVRPILDEVNKTRAANAAEAPGIDLGKPIDSIIRDSFAQGRPTAEKLAADIRQATALEARESQSVAKMVLAQYDNFSKQTAASRAANQIGNGNGKFGAAAGPGSRVVVNAKNIQAAFTHALSDAKTKLADADYKGALTWLRQKLQDKRVDLDNIQRAFAQKMGWERMPDSMNAYQAMETAVLKRAQKQDQLQKVALPEFIKLIKDRKVSLDDLHEFMQAGHAPERNAYIASINDAMPDGGSGITNLDAHATLKRFDTEGKTNALKAGAEYLDSMLRDNLQRKVDAGLISQATMDEMLSRYKYYVPLKGRPGDLDEDERDMGMNVGRGDSLRGREYKQAFGRYEEAANNIPAQIFADTSENIARCEKAVAQRPLLEFMRQYPEDCPWKVAQAQMMPIEGPDGKVRWAVDPSWMRANDVVTVKENGHTLFLKFENKRLAQALNGAGPSTNNIILRGIRKWTDYATGINTRFNPAFVISNFARHIAEVGFNLSAEETKSFRNAVLWDAVNGNSMKGVSDALGGKTDSEWSKEFLRMQKAGGRMLFTGPMDVEGFEKRMTELTADRETMLARAKDIFGATAHWIEHANTTVENAVRLSAFHHALKNGMTEAQAAHLAADISINYTRKGEWGNVMNTLYMFSNASVQTTARMMLAVGRSPSVRRLAYGVVAAGFGMELINRLMGGNDKDGIPYYDKIPDHIKNRNIIMMLPGTEGKYAMYPSPYGYSVLAVLGRSLGAVLPKTMGGAGASPLKAGSDVLLDAGENFSPMGGSSSLLMGLVPSIARPFFEVAMNKDFANREIVPEPGHFERFDKPPSQRFFPSTSEPSKAVADWLNTHTGGDRWKAGGISISPAYLDYGVNQIFGGAGKFVSQTVSTPMKLYNGEECFADAASHGEIPFLNRIFGETPENATSQQYKDVENGAFQAEARIKGLVFTGDRDAIKAAMQEDRDFLSLLPVVKATDDQLSALRKDQVAIEKITSFSDADKNQRLLLVDQRMQDVKKAALKAYYTAQLQHR